LGLCRNKQENGKGEKNDNFLHANLV
jgi:hypothetical protein